MCMVRVAVYTLVHGFSSLYQFPTVYERTRYMYGIHHSVHDYTRLMEIGKVDADLQSIKV